MFFGGDKCYKRRVYVDNKRLYYQKKRKKIREKGTMNYYFAIKGPTREVGSSKKNWKQKNQF